MITFKAGPGANVPVLPGVANKLILAMGRQAHEPGEVPVEQIPDVLARLRQAFDDSIRDAPPPRHLQPAANGSHNGNGSSPRPQNSPAERTAPAIELFELSLLFELFNRAQRTRHPVRWS